MFSVGSAKDRTFRRNIKVLKEKLQRFYCNLADFCLRDNDSKQLALNTGSHLLPIGSTQLQSLGECDRP